VVSHDEAQQISTVLDAMLDSGEDLPVSRQHLLAHIAGQVPGMVTNAQVLTVVRSRQSLADASDSAEDDDSYKDSNLVKSC
jgi:hypothetical protein